MSDWIWVLLTALIVFFGVSVIGDTQTREPKQNVLELSSASSDSITTNTPAESSPVQARDSSSTSASSEESQSSKGNWTSDVAIWAPILIIPLAVLAIRGYQFFRNSSKNLHPPHAGSTPS